MVEELKSMVGVDETILYEGKPDKKCFIFESIFNPLLPFAIVWAIIDVKIIGINLGMGGMSTVMSAVYVVTYDAGLDIFVGSIVCV